LAESQPDDGGVRHWSAARDSRWIYWLTVVLGSAISVIALAFAYDLELIRILEIPEEQALPTILGAAFVIIFLGNPVARSGPLARAPWSNICYFVDIVLAAVGFGICLYFAYRYNDLIEDFYFNRATAFAVGIVIIPLIIEALRRTAGWSLVAVVSCFFVYAMVGHLVPGDLQGQEKKFYNLIAYLTADNVALFGLPMKIVTFIVVLFIFMGQLLLKSGASEWFTDLAAAFLGRSRGGSAKIAVVASGLFGSISGSAVSNVASTGVITIPLMRKGGYDAKTAGAFEAVASTGGQIMPPIMGAAAFLMAEFLELEYTEIIIAALIPSILYYFSAFVQADLEAARLKIAPIPEDQIPPKSRVMKEGWFFIMPYVILVIALFSFNKPASEAALWASFSLPVVALLFGFKKRRLSFVDFVVGLVRGAEAPGRLTSDFGKTIWAIFVDICKAVADSGRTSVDIIIIGAMAGLIIGIIETTGFGSALTIVLLKVGEDSLMLLLVLTAGISIILGMGMPTTAIYVLLALMVAPPLIKLGIDPLSAHLFVLYYGLMSMITPPVAIAAFTAAKLAGASPMATAVTACRLGWVAYVIPFVFVFQPALIMRGSAIDVIASLIAALVGVWIASAGFLGYLFDRLNLAFRVIYVVAGMSLLLPVNVIDEGFMIRIAGAALTVLLVGRELLAKRRTQATQAAQ